MTYLNINLGLLDESESFLKIYERSMQSSRTDIHYLRKYLDTTIDLDIVQKIELISEKFEISEIDELNILIQSVIKEYEIPPQLGKYQESDWDKPIFWIYDVIPQISREKDCDANNLYLMLPYYSATIHYHEDKVANYFTFPQDGFNTLYVTLTRIEGNWEITYDNYYPEKY